MLDHSQNDDLLFSAETTPIRKLSTHLQPWRILIVDDDPDVHTATTFALRGTEILGRQLTFLHADSALQARDLLRSDQDIAVVLLDVVMEEEDSGLHLVRFIREELGMEDTRIILRTGQPGYAPEMEAIRDYDINDYKTKSELTRNKLFTALTAAIRSYRQIRTINAQRHGLDMIVRASGELLALSGIRNFAAGVITQMAGLLGVMPEGLICVRRPTGEGEADSSTVIIAAAGRYANLINLPLDEVTDPHVKLQLERCLSEEHHVFEDENTTLFFGSRTQRNMAAFLDAPVALDDNAERLLEVFCTNISTGLDNTLLFAQLHDYAYLDTLTGLPNRRALLARIDERLQSGERGRYSLALLDLDGFAEINDALGHPFGDALLKTVAERLRSELGGQCALARLSADTFAILGLIETLLPTSLQNLFRTAFLVDAQELMLTATLGLVHLADVEGNGNEALKNASLALRRAKARTRGEYVVFTREMAIEVRERSRLMQALRQAIEHQHLFLCYQPQVSLGENRLIGLEALLRWRDTDGNLIEPSRFIPIAEHSGLIVGIGDWVLRMACFQQAALARAGRASLSMAVNVSVSQLHHPLFIANLKSALTDSGVDPACIELEITESMAMDEAEALIQTLSAIKALGVRIAVDDFGTGFSSLSYLQRLPIDRLKIDKAFTAELDRGEKAQRIPEVIIELGRRLGLGVIAEGVENSAQAQRLIELGCDAAQGYFYGRPMESDTLEAWLASSPLARH